VDRDQACELEKTLDDAGVPRRLIMLRGVGHTFALLDKGVDVRVVVTFFNTYLKPAK
jgi:acetyl esterase/lipase